MTDNPRPSLLTPDGFPPIIDQTSRVLVLGTLLSTSPAATRPLTEKIKRWSQIAEL